MCDKNEVLSASIAFMKKLLYPIFFLLLSCGLAAIDQNKAKTVAENLMKDLKDENYSNLDNYYTASFNESESLDQKIKKYKKLKEFMGPVQSYELLGTKQDNTSDNGGPKIELKYKMRCSKTTVIHTLIIINDEGIHKITFQNFEN